MLTAAAALAVAALLAGHRLVPGDAGTLLDTGLPWLGAAVPVLALAAALRRAPLAGAAVAVAAAVWAALFGTAFLPASPSGGRYDLRAMSQNMYAANPVPARTAARLIADRPDLLALQEIRAGASTARLDAAYPHRVVRGTVGLWSRLPITSSGPVDLGLGWPRALRAVVATGDGPLTVYVAHLGSARPGDTGERDATMDRLAARVRADASGRVLLLGDLNTATTDRKLGALVPALREAQGDAGSGLGFTWPSSFPLARPDHILYRGLDPVDAATARTPGSDHDAVRADFRF
ncbi:endonuclease/exonuclease/phosphatase family protein [Actinomadura sp. PM05-2]|uniref:Endonuclease/exonuclease/phosphatase family protein n=1 Tax=Actinomadura parmotrematis TaxID=2864039 RepID=A0ABS7FTY5_9ACTN|nr:endonuclease/exonuclease/phosphatase family protein [Actinomadura parmotrematis]